MNPHRTPRRLPSILLVALLFGVGGAAFLPTASADPVGAATYTCHSGGTWPADDCPDARSGTTVQAGDQVAFHNNIAGTRVAQAISGGVVFYTTPCLAAFTGTDPGFVVPFGVDALVIVWRTSCLPTAGVQKAPSVSLVFPEIIVDPEPCVREPTWLTGGDRVCVGPPPHGPYVNCHGVTRYYPDGSTLYAYVCADGNGNAYGCVGRTHPEEAQGGFSVQSSPSWSGGGYYDEDCAGRKNGCTGVWHEWGKYGANGDGTYWREPYQTTWTTDPVC